MDHVSFGVTCYAKSFAFYEALLKPLGFEPFAYFEKEGEYKVGSLRNASGFAVWLSSGPDDFKAPSSCAGMHVTSGDEKCPSATVQKEAKRMGDIPGFHYCFSATSTQMVDGWHALGLSLGAKNNGDPGLRPHYHPGYYGAFLVDPFDGWRLEVVFHQPHSTC